MDTEAHASQFSIDPLNFLSVSNIGGRIVHLVLGGITVIQKSSLHEKLGAGSYVMFPWVNRLEKEQDPYKPAFRDGKGLPLHGLAADLRFKFSVETSEERIEIVLSPEDLPENLPEFEQVFVLTPKSLSVGLSYKEDKNGLPVCFGFHPYLQINELKLADLRIHTNIQTNLKLDEQSLLPVYPFVKEQIEIQPNAKYDSLFYCEAGYLRLENPNGPEKVEIRSEGMPYWQVYTPPDGIRIAVEPMTFCGNLYSIYDRQEFGELPKSAEFSLTVL